MRETPALFAIAVLCLALALVIGSTHDYGLYLSQWDAIWRGNPPWAQSLDGAPLPINAYGPLHLIFAPFAALHPLLPKCLLVAMMLGAFAVILAERLARERFWPLALAFPLAPVVLIAVAVFGNNDAAVALCLVLAVAAFARDRPWVAGLCIGIAVLLKFYPLLFAGFLVARHGRARLTVPLVALAVFLGGMAAAVGIWGWDALSPLTYGGDRSAKMLSVLRALSGVERLSEAPWLRHLIDRNALYVLGMAALVALHGWLARLDWEVTVLLGGLAVFATYKVGHPQFYVGWVALQAWCLARAPTAAPGRVATAFLPVSWMVSAFQALYLLSWAVTGDFLAGGWAVLRDYASLPVLAAILWGLWRARADLFRRWRWPVAVSL